MSEPLTLVFVKAGLDNGTSAVVRYQLQFQLDLNY